MVRRWQSRSLVRLGPRRSVPLYPSRLGTANASSVAPSRSSSRHGPSKASVARPPVGYFASIAARVSGIAAARELSGEVLDTRVVADQHYRANLLGQPTQAPQKRSGARRIEASLDLDHGLRRKAFAYPLERLDRAGRG